MATQEAEEPAVAELYKALEAKGFVIEFHSHAKSILYGEFEQQLRELAMVLDGLSLPMSEILGSGGGETKFTQRMRHQLSDMGWPKHIFVIGKTIDGTPREATSHEVDHVRKVDGVGTIACEIEWNNKDPFFDRDLENFKRLHAEGAISAAILITRGKTLQESMYTNVLRFAKDRGIKDFDELAANGITPTKKQADKIERRMKKKKDPLPFDEAWAHRFVADKYGQATTHWSKLQDRVDRGVGNPCPLLLIGLPESLVVFDHAVVEQMSEDDLASEENGTEA
jgi:hypothetical protein